MSIKFLVLERGGVFWVLGGGGECRFYFYGRGAFSECMYVCMYVRAQGAESVCERRTGQVYFEILEFGGVRQMHALHFVRH